MAFLSKKKIVSQEGMGWEKGGKEKKRIYRGDEWDALQALRFFQGR